MLSTTSATLVHQVWRGHQTRAALQRARERGVVPAVIELADAACARHGCDMPALRAWMDDVRSSVAAMLVDASVLVGDTGRVWFPAVLSGDRDRAVFVYIETDDNRVFRVTVDPVFDGVWR
jgi:hypothetical protein